MKTHLLSFVLFFFPVLIFAQNNDPVIMSVNGKDVKKSEFEYIYNKNNNAGIIDKKTFEEYIDLFKNFKLKVAEAEAQGIDTTDAFKSELADYRYQLANPYLPVPVVDESLLQKEYDRMEDLVQVAHIQVLFPRNTEAGSSLQLLPADTLETYKKISQAYSRLKKGEDFGKIASEYSEDIDSKDNQGNIGWISGMVLFPALEDAVFSLEVGQFSQPVRASYGYHIFKVLSKKPNPGKIKASHILIPFSADADEAQKEEALNQIEDIYKKIIVGADFAEMAREHSQDGSASRGGDLGWFGYGFMVPDFEDVAFGLQHVGEVSRPFASPYGYHIVKLSDRRILEPYEVKKQEIESMFSRGGFFIQLHRPSIENMKKENHFAKNGKAYESLMNAAIELYPMSDEYIGKFIDSNETLFSFGDKEISIAEFINYLLEKEYTSHTLSTDILSEKLEEFEYDRMVQFEDESLESKYPDFRNLMKEYRDGILMFEVTNKEVWSRASEDTEGLAQFFENNTDNYTWTEPHYKGYVVLVKDAATKKEIQKKTAKMTQEDAINYMLENYKVGSVSYVRVEKGLFKKGDNAFIDEVVFKTGKAELPESFGDFFVVGKTINAPESYMDVRGQAITDYQDYLEAEWLKKLNEKYPVVLYKDVIFTEK